MGHGLHFTKLQCDSLDGGMGSLPGAFCTRQPPAPWDGQRVHCLRLQIAFESPCDVSTAKKRMVAPGPAPCISDPNNGVQQAGARLIVVGNAEVCGDSGEPSQIALVR